MRKPGHILVSIAALLTMLGVVFGLLLVPMPVRRSGHWCPSLLDVAMLGPNPSARVKTELGMPLGSFYYACTRKGPVTMWALFWLATVVIFLLLMVVVFGRLLIRPLVALSGEENQPRRLEG
jgi:hypothetical protein